MTAAWLEVPTPDGDLAAIEMAARELRDAASAVAVQQRRLHLATAETLESWQGAAAAGFAFKEGVAEESLRIVGTSYDSAAARMESYAASWSRAHSDATTAHHALGDAVAGYVRGAQGVLEQVVGAISGFLAGAAGIVDAIVPGDQSALIEFAHRLRGWSPPAERPTLRVVDCGGGPLESPSSILERVRDAAGWGVSHLLEGAGWVINLIGDAISFGLSALHRLEEAFAAAVANALAVAYKAINALVALGTRVATAVAKLASDILKAVWRASVKAIETVVDAVFDLADALADGARALADAVHLLVTDPKKALGLAGLGLLILLSKRPGADQRRLSEADARRLDRAASRSFRDPDDYERYRELAYVAGVDVYNDRSGKLPPGWHRMDDAELRGLGIDPSLLQGDAGFEATIYSTPDGIVVAYRGSEPFWEKGSSLGERFHDALDWGTDIDNGLGLPTKQGRQAVDLARLVSQKFDNVTFTGHSLGGGLAAMASIATGRPAVTYNAAGIGHWNYEMARSAYGPGANESHIINFKARSDILTIIQETGKITPAAGAQVTLIGNTTDPVRSHAVDTFIDLDTPWRSLSP